MATGLANRPDQDNDVDPLESLSDLESQLDEKYGGNFAALDEKKDSTALKGGELQDAEEDAAAPGATKAEQAERDLAPNFDEGSKKSLRARLFNRKSVAGGAIAVTLLGGGFGVFTFLQGPLQIIQLANVLSFAHFTPNEDAGDGRVGRLIQYARNTPNRSNMGLIGNKIADKYETKLRQSGFELDFSTPSANQSRFIQGFKVDTNTEQGRQAVDNMRTRGIKVDTFSIDEKKIMNIDLRGSGGTKLSQGVLRSSLDSMNMSKKSSALARRLLAIRAGVDFHPLKNRVREKGQSLQDWYTTLREERKQRRTNGSLDPEGSLADDRQVDEDGNTIAEPDIDSSEAVASGIESKIDVNTNGVKKATEGIREKLTGGAGAAAAVGVICAVKAVGNASEDIQYANIVLPLIKVGTEAVAAGSQVMSGQGTNLEELGMISDDLYDATNESSWASARSIQAEQGQELTGDEMPSVANPANVGEKPALFALIDRIPGIGVACGGAGQAVMTVLGGFTDFAVDKLISTISSVTGVDPVGKFAEWIARKLAGEEVDPNAAGAVYGNYANYGARLAANDSAISMGGRELTDAEVTQIDAESNEYQQRQFATESFLTRMFDTRDSRSLIAKSVLQNPALSNPKVALASFTKLPMRLFSSVGSFASVFSRPASAQTANEYSYGFPEYGFSLNELDNPDFEDPYANAELLEANNGEALSFLNQEYGDCFAMTVNPTTGVLEVKGAKRYDQIAAKCKSNDPLLLRYRFYLMDMINVKALSCYESIDESQCTELGFPGKTGSTTSAPVTGDARGVDTSGRQCAVGQDGGIGDTPIEGTKIRLCSVGGITVNVAIEANVDAAIKGAQAAGITLSGSGYRSYQSQIALRRQNCGDSYYAIYTKPAEQCSPATAIPGTSLHEWGIAVDFKCNGQPSMSRSSVCFQWLDANPSVHNLKNLPSEAWHWSSTGN